jgi:hypothetical protein
MRQLLDPDDCIGVFIYFCQLLLIVVILSHPVQLLLCCAVLKHICMTCQAQLLHAIIGRCGPLTWTSSALILCIAIELSTDNL